MGREGEGTKKKRDKAIGLQKYFSLF